MSEAGHHHREISGKNLGIALLLNVFITLAQAIGGIISGSIALLSDAAHNLSDVFSMAISYLANILSRRDATEKQTFGFRRSEILAAFINSVTLIVISVVILIEAIKRLVNPITISADLVIYFALGGIVVNGVSLVFIRKDSKENLNMRSVYIHLFGDMITSVAVLLGGFLMKYLQWFRADSVFSIVIALYLLYLSWGILRSSVHIIMQFTPEKTDIRKIVSEIEQVKGIKNIHHVHVWQINEHDLMFEAHIDLSEDMKISGFENILEDIKMILSNHNIHHLTIQPEFTVDDNKQVIP
jgi:cobalt-zinc-cadmium efflux system protein